MSRESTLGTKRAEVLIQVLAGNLTSTAGAKALDISRNRYYHLEKRGLEGMVEHLEDRPTGRPSQPEDPEKEALKQQVVDLQDLLTDALRHLELKKLMEEVEAEEKAAAALRNKKKRQKKRKRRR